MNTRILLGHAQFHGAKRLIEPRHRIFWGLAMVILLCAALSNFAGTVLRFLDAPTHLMAGDTVTAKITFPTVLVCPEVYFPEYKIEKFLSRAKYPSGMTADSIRPIIQQVTAFYSPDAPYTVRELSLVQKFLEHNYLDVEQAGFALTASCKKTVLRCRFYKQDLNCSEIFNMEVTTYGFCCVFNGRSLKRELKEMKGESKKPEVWKTLQVGPFAPLMLVVNQSQYLGNIDLNYKWLVIQRSNRYIDGTNNGTAISPGREIWSSFHSYYLRVAEDTHFLGEQLRGCSVENKKLKYYPTYNKKMCLIECSMEEIIRLCKCLLPVHHRPPGVPLCPARNLRCARKSFEQFKSGGCDCPNSCEYEVEMIDTQSYDLSSKAEPIDSFYYGLNFSQVTVVRVFLKSHQTTSFLRRPVFNFYDLFSQLGGVFNVFFGCSILSIFELLQLALYKFKDRYKLKTIRQKTKTEKRRNKMSYLLFSSCRANNGRVRKKNTKKKVKFLNKNLIHILNIKS